MLDALRSDRALWLVLLLAATLIFGSLGDRVLWQDEAETALLAKGILRHGVPVAWDGTNLVSQEVRTEFGPDFLWRWSPWIQFYLAAASFAALGSTTLAARLPFAILGFATVPLTYLLGLRYGGSRGVARWSAVALATSVPFLLHVRQARWCAPAYLLVTLLLLALVGMERGGRAALAGYAAAGAALFYTNYLVAIGLLVALALAAPLLGHGRPFLWRLLLASVVAGLLSMPGIFFFDVVGKAGGMGLGFGPEQLWSYSGSFFAFLTPLPLLALLAVGPAAARRQEGRGIRFLAAAAGLFLLYVSFANWRIFRYLSILFPVGAVLSGAALARLGERRPRVCVLLALVILGTDVLHQFPLGFVGNPGAKWIDRLPGFGPVRSPLLAYVGELLSPVDDPEAVISRHLAANANPGDVVLATYGDLPLQFETGLKVVGGFQGGPYPAEPDWIVVRPFFITREPEKDLAVHQFIQERIDRSRYRPVLLSGRDFPLGGNPDPAFHFFREPADWPPTQILQRLPPGAPPWVPPSASPSAAEPSGG